MIPLALAVGILAFQQAEAFDFSKVNREVVSEPTYAGSPRYALILFGADDRHRMWLVLDESKPGAKRYDVLYADLNGNGKIGEAGERFAISNSYNDRWEFLPGPVAIEGCALKVERFRLAFYFAEADPYVFFTFKVDQKVRLHGGLKADLRFGESRAAAPVLRAHPYGPLTLKVSSPDFFLPGGSGNLSMNAGIPGSSPAAFMTVDERFIDLEKGKLTAEIAGLSSEGKEAPVTFRLKNYCCGSHYEGLVEIPKELPPGPIKFRVRYEPATGGPTVLPAEFSFPQEPKTK